MNEETQESQTETAVEEPTESTEEKTSDASVATDTEDKSKDLRSALAQKDHYKEKLAKAEADRKALEAKLNAIQKQSVKQAGLDVEDYIDISASLDGLDQREKSYLAEQHKLTGRPLQEIRSSEDFGLWQSAYRSKVEKENKTLPPSSEQVETPPEKTLAEKLRDAKSVDESEQLLREAGYISTGPRRNPNAGKMKLG